MNRDAISVLLLGLVAMLAAGCQRRSPEVRESESAPAAEPWHELVRLPRQTLVVEPTRDDLTVGKVVLSLYCSEPDAMRVNGVAPRPEWQEVHLGESGVVVDSEIDTTRSEAWIYIALPRAAANRFELAPFAIELAPGYDGRVCLSLKAWFEEVPNEYDAMFYENPEDRYALVAWCSDTAGLRSDLNARFGMNRVTSVEQFALALGRPVEVRLNSRPIRDEWRSP